MTSNLEKFRKDLDSLIGIGESMYGELVHEVKPLKGERKKVSDTIYNSYQKWFSESVEVISQLLPSRLDEFRLLYNGDPKRKTVDLETYSIRDWLLGMRSATKYDGSKRFEDVAVVVMKLQTQLQILMAAERRFESSLFDIRQMAQADLFDSELEIATELLKNKFDRAAGAIAGVVLEKHLIEVIGHHGVSIAKKDPNISDLNDGLKSSSVIDTPTWRYIQRLGDIRNMCVHNKNREPTSGEVEELIDGVKKISKTIY